MPILRLDSVLVVGDVPLDVLEACDEVCELLILRLDSVLVACDEVCDVLILRLDSVLEVDDVLPVVVEELGLLVALGLGIDEVLVRQRCIIQKHIQTHLEHKV